MDINRTSSSVEKKEKHKYILDAISDIDKCIGRLDSLLADIGASLSDSREEEKDATGLTLAGFLTEAPHIILKKTEIIISKVDEVRNVIL